MSGNGRSAIERAYDRLIDACGLSTAISVLFLTFGITISVAARALGLGTIDWMLEASEYALLVLTFLGAPWALRRGAHVKVDVITSSMPPALARACEIIANLLGLAVSVVLFGWGFKTGLLSERANSVIYKVLIFPEWWLYTLITFSGALLSVEFVRRLVRTDNEENQTPTDML